MKTCWRSYWWLLLCRKSCRENVLRSSLGANRIWAHELLGKAGKPCCARATDIFPCPKTSITHVNDSVTRAHRRQRLLVIDDDPSLGVIARDLFASDPVDVLAAETGATGLELIRERHPDVVILDHYLPDTNGREVFDQVRALDPRLPVIWVTARGTSETAIEATKVGAFDFLTKPIDLDKLREQVHQAITSRQLMLVPVEINNQSQAQTNPESDTLVGRCNAMQEVYKAIGRIAAHDVPALLVGEPGTGKELVARAIYQHGPRSRQPFMKVRCGDFPAEQLELQLFGEQLPDGTVRHGKIEQIAGGVLLLEELAAIEPGTQSKLLRLVRERKFQRVRGEETLMADVTLLFTTQHDPEALVRSQKLHSDFFYVLSSFLVQLPPLRQRREDLPLLVEHFIHRFSNIHKSFGNGVVRVSHDALRLIQTYDWPGNVAELLAVQRRALLETKGTVLASDYLRRALRNIHEERRSPAPTAMNGQTTASSETITDWPDFVGQRIAGESTEVYAEAMVEMERHVLREVLAYTGGNQAHAARILGITRTSLRKKIHLLGINIGRVVTAG